MPTISSKCWPPLKSMRKPWDEPHTTPMLTLTTSQRDELLETYRKDHDPELRFRAHIVLLLADGRRWDTIEDMLFCSSRTVDRWLKRYEAEGFEGLTGRKRGRPFRFGVGWV